MNDSSINDAIGGRPGRSPSSDAQPVNTLIGWGLRVLASNPFYLASAGFLLYGINRLSSDPRLTGAEHSQLIFNFCALFGYEILLVLTAILLARRSIWYDALLLVSLENFFVLIPFSLVSRVVLLDQILAWGMCAAATVLAGAKFWALKRCIPELSLSWRLLLMGAIVMVANVAIALGLPRLEQHRTVLLELLRLSWLFGLPLLGSLVYWLANPCGALRGRKWFGQATILIWVVVTAGHLGGVGYVYDFHWRLPLLAPTLWVLAWALHYRSTDWVSTPARFLQRPTLFGPPLITMLALTDDWIFPALNVLNVIAYAIIYLRNRGDRVVLGLGLCCLVAALAGMPADWTRQISPHSSRLLWSLYCLSGCVICLTALSSDPRVGLPGGAATFVAAGYILDQLKDPWGFAREIALVFVIVHSLRWEDERHRGAQPARMMFVLVWIVHSFFRVQMGANAIATSLSLAFLVIALYFARRLSAGCWPPVIIPCGALAVLAASPLHELAHQLRRLSAGHLSVGAGFLLFALGTLLALTKPKWKKT